MVTIKKISSVRSTVFEVLNRDDRHKVAGLVYEGIMLFMIVISILPLMFMNQRRIFTTFDIVSTVAFIIDYLARWWTADYLLKRGWRSFVIYPFTAMAIIDLLSILPGINVLAPSFKLFRLTRIFRIFRVMRLLRYSSKVLMFVKILKKQRTVLFSVLVLAVFYIFITAIIMFNVEPAVNPVTGARTFHNFIDALYWSATTLTTVGYGDIVPVTTAGRVVSMLSALFGVAIIALPSGVITGAYLDELKREQDAKSRNAKPAGKKQKDGLKPSSRKGNS